VTRSAKLTGNDTLNILFTCVGRRVSLIQSFRQAMAELKLKGEIVASDITKTSPAFHTADVGVTVPTVDMPDYIPALLEVVKRHKVELLVPLTDLDLLILSRKRGIFEQAGCAVMVGSEQAVAACMDKAHTNEIVRRAGLAAIRTCTLEQFRAEPFYPCFIKPVRGSAGVGAAVISGPEQLDAHVSIFGNRMLLQEYVYGQEFTIDVYRSRKGKVLCVVPRQRLIVRSGEVEKAVTVNDAQLIEAAVKLSEQLGDIWGVFCCQCRRIDDGADRPRFFEINPRFGGGAPLSIAAGANLPLYLLQEATGRPITAELGKFKDGLLMLRYNEAVFVQARHPASLPGYNTPQFR